eukprot:Protomagalhaensia_sp_Gyna_25__1348@NODE_1678_length_1631_cov_37_841709_g507_i1_p1_GENE_NODE_1678_length_1631_cov_37_841709_g507_i1NODE_1678_length_1631_cov_37_841709_g507_i1_p1_ORF_typecomplete_len286_score54_15_NODE_1678_length_1631_cov_37_841709_g507_i17361593
MGSCKSTPRKQAEPVAVQQANTTIELQSQPSAVTNQPVATGPVAQLVSPEVGVVAPRSFDNPIGPNPPPVPPCAAAVPPLTTVVEVASSGSSTPRVVSPMRASSSALLEETSSAVEEQLIEPEIAKEPVNVQAIPMQASSSDEGELETPEKDAQAPEKPDEEPMTTRMSMAASEMTSLSSVESLAPPVREIKLAETSSSEEEPAQKIPSRSLSSSQTPIQRRLSITSEDIPDELRLDKDERSENEISVFATATTHKSETRQVEIQEVEAFEVRCCQGGLLSMCIA